MIRPEPPLKYWAYNINESHRLTLVVVKNPVEKDSMLSNIRLKGLVGLKVASELLPVLVQRDIDIEDLFGTLSALLLSLVFAPFLTSIFEI